VSKRINTVLPEENVGGSGPSCSQRDRSQFISRAVLHFVEMQGKEALRERLKQEALLNADRDLKSAAEWLPVKEPPA
jgi:hypothetical protein